MRRRCAPSRARLIAGIAGVIGIASALRAFPCSIDAWGRAFLGAV
jgi:hypothetical protein